MEIGVIVRYGGVIPGREEAAVQAFTETTHFYDAQLANGTFTFYEPFMFRTGDFQQELGFFIVKGPEEKVISWFDSKESRLLRTKVELIVNHLTIEFLYTGTDVLEQVALLNEVAKEKVTV
jgi:hypothetical protein